MDENKELRNYTYAYVANSFFIKEAKIDNGERTVFLINSTEKTPWWLRR